MHPKQMQRKCLLVFVLVLYTSLFSAIVFSAESGSSSLPSAFFPEARYEFTPVLEGTSVTHAFIVKNKGTAPLKIEKVRTG